jgi:hypothetical protein
MIWLASRLHRGLQRFDGLGKVIKSEADGPAMSIRRSRLHFEDVGGGGDHSLCREGRNKESELSFSIKSGKLAAPFSRIGQKLKQG